MFSLLRRLFKPHVKPMNVITIDKKTILRNFDLLQKLQPKAELFPVLKSNAYGHGLLQMVKILKRVEVPYVAVDSFPEYQVVVKNSHHHVLVMGETLLENYRYFDPKKTAFAVYNK